MPITLLYYKVTPESINSAQQSEQIDDWSKELPIIKQKRVKKLRQQQDQLLSLAGLQLLKKAMSEYPEHNFSLQQLKFPEQGKPFFMGDIDFNISHSGNIVCCVLSPTAKVGVDIERLRDVSPAIVDKFLFDSSGLKENMTQDNIQPFFNRWTKNEAIIKAANNGSVYNMSEIKHENDGGYFQNHFWSTFPIEISSAKSDKEYICHIACSKKMALNEITVTQIYSL